MKSNQEILDRFGKLVVNSILDRYYEGIEKIINCGYKNPTKLDYNELFNNLNEKEKNLLPKYLKPNLFLKTAFFVREKVVFLRFFSVNSRFF
jgi:hypothetical protein